MSTQNNDSSSYEVFIPKINELAQQFVDDLLKEKASLSGDFPLIAQVIDDAIDRVYSTGRIPGRDLPADIYKQKPIKLAQNIYLPTKQYPSFNFKGKILGPKGNTLKRLHYETMCNIAIKGRTSMRDEEREEALRQSGEPSLSHLKKNLHVEISTVAPPAEAYARIAYALTEIRKYIIPDSNDEISQEQYRELMEMNPEYAKKPTVQRSVFGKLQALKGGFLGKQEEHEDYDDRQQHFAPPQHFTPPQQRNQNNGGGFRPSPYNRNQGPTSSAFIDKAKELRSRPYQKYTPFKK